MLHVQMVDAHVKDVILAVQAVPGIEAFSAMTGPSLLDEYDVSVVVFVQITPGLGVRPSNEAAGRSCSRQR